MTISQGLTTSFLRECLLGVHDFRVGGDTFKIALYTANASLNSDTTAYTATGEVTGTGYSAGGMALTSLGTSSNTTNQVAYVSFSTATFTTVTLTARGALIYNSTPSANGPDDSPLTNPAVCVLDFGSDKTFTAQNCVIEFPANDYQSAIVRIGTSVDS